MEHSKPEILRDPGEAGLTDQENSEAFCLEKEQTRCSPCMVTEEGITNGSWSQRSLSRSLQRAETLLRTFNPGLKWLFQGRQDEEDMERHFVVAHNLVSRSSARLLRLHQAVVTVAPQWQSVGREQTGSPRVCVKGLPADSGVLLLPSSLLLHGHHSALWRLLEQRVLLLFIHEFTRRARLTAAFISRVRHLLEEQLKNSHLTLNQSSSVRGGLCSLSQELRVHLSHWSCLFSRVQHDPPLRAALSLQSELLLQVRGSLELLGVQALLLVEQYVYALLCAVAHTEGHCVPRELLQDILAGTELYNQAVGEQRAQHSATQLRTAVLQQAHYPPLDSSQPSSRGPHPAAFSLKELMRILAVHQADVAAQQLHCMASEQTREASACCQNSSSRGAGPNCRTPELRPEWTWEQLQQTYLTPSPLFSTNHPPLLQTSSRHRCHQTPPVYIPDLHVDRTLSENPHPVQAKPPPVHHRPGCFGKGHTDTPPTSVNAFRLAKPHVEKQTSLEKQWPTISLPPAPIQPPSLSGLCQQDQSSVELLFQVLLSSNELLAPLVSHAAAPGADQLLSHTAAEVFSANGKAPVRNTADSADWNIVSTELNKDQRVDGLQEWAELEIPPRPEAAVRDGAPEKEDPVGVEGATDGARWPYSVQWLDVGQSVLFADVCGQYRSLLWALCSKALRLQLHVPTAGGTAGSINLQHTLTGFHILHSMRHASHTDLIPEECRTMLQDFSLYVLVVTAHAQWDNVLCRSLGSALKDKCLTVVNQPSSEHDGDVMMSETMKHFLLLSPPLLSSVCGLHSNSMASASVRLSPPRLTLQSQTVSLLLATVQLSTVWVMSKAYQFLSSWSLNKFLLISQGDLKVLSESLEMMLHQTKSLMIHLDSNQSSSVHPHSQLLLRRRLGALDGAVSELQTFSSLLLHTFSSDCKRMSGEIFEQTMPSAGHWRPSLRTGFPSSPSEYVSLAAQTVIGQVLEGVAPLSEDARVQALSITTTAFMEAWMEHILKQRIKFSVQGALQLKQDFDSIRELIQSDRYGLSAELHQRLLSLRVFQQVDSAVMCLLQQPQAKPYLRPRAWEPFTRCCPASSRDSMDAAGGSSITNLRSMEGEELTPCDPSVVTSDLPPLNPSSPGEPYLAPSAALGAAQREWLELRIHSSTPRWRLPGLHCLWKSEP
ncbi:hypothetical protein JOQ06_023358 [Pogonophryne albipinna]|uniref:Coiled-coil protein 142 C-terminal domain-containing protein n=1 Tax=Pogonophryne albipinna TaxID=1090488 RepID=A0AAD6FRQ9_9TELE|nr:hypothetical protein JOQ06_023358 [Pogonophryne albipinna]